MNSPRDEECVMLSHACDHIDAVAPLSFAGKPEQVGMRRAVRKKRASRQRRREAQIELAHADRVATMGRLAASITHEIRQPLAAAVANAQAASRWLGRQTPNLDEAQAALARVVTACDLASTFVGRIRNLIRKAPPRKQNLDLNQTVQEVVALIRGEVIKNGVSLEMRLADDLPIVRADRVQLQQVMLNLIINAIEALSCVGKGSRELLIGTGKDGTGRVRVTVRDSGPGVSPKSGERIFDEFYSTKPGGMGMGLSICRSIIEAHHGRLWASANSPRGAMFQFTLPAKARAVT
jgi:C4-dicarboxylate-specific signal transduction histidine kinase